MDYLKEEQHYIDRYDLNTIKQCLDYAQSVRNGFDKERGVDKFKKYINKSFNRETQKVINVFINTLKGQRFKDKAITIQGWMDKDRKEQEKYDNATPPTGITCKECNAPTKVTSKDFLHSYEENAQVLFMFRCIKCNKGQAFYEDGTEWIYDPPKCPQCTAPLNSEYKDVDDESTTSWSCPDCSYKKEDTYDFKQSRLEREKEEAESKKLLAEHRVNYCLSDEKGQEMVELFEAMDVSKIVYEEEMRKYDDSAYERVTELKKLNIIELEKLLTQTLEKEKFIKLSLDKPEMGVQVIVPFTVQDADPSRKENISTDKLKKLLKDTLETTNWRLMRDGIHNRLGFLYGKLKGYEGEEAMLELAGKKKEQKPLHIDDEKRMKYASHNVVQMARLKAEIKGAEKIRKKRLLKEPQGFAIPGEETYSCYICLTHINSANGWYDKHGFKCLDCQRASNEGILPPEVFDEENSWYSDWHIESEFFIPRPTIKKLVLNGYLKPRIVTHADGRHHEYVFMALENNELLLAYMEKHRIILLCGIPGSGKTAFGKYLHDKHGHTYTSLEGKEWEDKKMQSLWDNIFTAKRQHYAVEKFVCYLHDNYENVVLDWGFSMDQMDVASSLRSESCYIVWFTCNIATARKRFLKRNKNSATYFDTQIKIIQENNKKIADRLKPKVIDVLKENRTDKTMEDIYSDFSVLIEDA